MKRLLATAIAALIAMPVLAAPPPPNIDYSNMPQGQNQGGNPPQTRMQALTEILSLNTDQTAAVQAIMAEQQKSRQAMRQANQQQRQASREQLKKSLSTVLNDTQMALFEAFQKGMQMGHRPPKGMPPRR